MNKYTLMLVGALFVSFISGAISSSMKMEFGIGWGVLIGYLIFSMGFLTCSILTISDRADNKDV